MSRLVSTAGGIHPVWRPDGKELYYLNPAGAMMAAPISVTGSTLTPSIQSCLFHASTAEEWTRRSSSGMQRGA